MPRRARGCACPSDLTDAQWVAIAPMIPDAAPGGRRRKADKREIVKAILYLLRAGCVWRLLPHDFPPWQTVYDDLRVNLRPILTPDRPPNLTPSGSGHVRHLHAMVAAREGPGGA